ncbi:HdeD family acid-resistance protein [Thermomonospora umbrina]|uniref:Uncharacterized membrane protein HdeD (DUF308 family) n=1 Tax=Thermomonospora umbrina TaxID=111806 RepID=A0A3D9T315_9ACTN|nr:HdeD family acid-resistance protein [Thermomonospora umbrina]REE99154.1 uncharacterized membrane protein HdeD (DUF308 family) [Thermomonospora umbrina]
MIEQWGRAWWMLALRGAVAILFGLLAWIWPGITVWALVLLFGIYALADGVLALVAAFRGASGSSRGWLVVAGVAGIVAGVVAFAWPGVTALALLMLIAAWAVVTGVFEIVAALSLRREIEGEWWYVAGGALSVLFGFLLFLWPVGGALAVVWLIGLFSILFGIALVAAAFRVKRLAGFARRGAGPEDRPGGTAAAHS